MAAGPPAAGPVAGYTYDTVGNLDTVAYPNGVQHSYSYDTMNRLTHLAVASVGLTLAQFDYRLDATGHRTNLVESLNSQPATQLYSWRYDSLHRLTNETIALDSQPPTLNQFSYTYDIVGNRLTRGSDHGALNPQSFSYGSNDWLNTDTYDANGNTQTGQASSTVPLVCLYDWANRLTNAVIGSKTIALTYNASGHRVRKVVTEAGQTTTTRYLVDDHNLTGYAQVLEEHISLNSQPSTFNRQYIYGLDLILQSTPGPQPSTLFFGYDGHGSTRLLTDGSGAVTATFAYDAFGTLMAQTPDSIPQTLYLYAGEQWDPDLGLYYNRARYLNPDTGRFWSMDSFEGSGEDPLTLHKYLYANADPLNGVDPSGNETLLSLNAATAIQFAIRGFANVTASAGIKLITSKVLHTDFDYSVAEGLWDFTAGGIVGAGVGYLNAGLGKIMGKYGSSAILRFALYGGASAGQGLVSTLEWAARKETLESKAPTSKEFFMVWAGSTVVSAILNAAERSAKVSARNYAALNFFKSYTFLEWLAKPGSAPLAVRQFLNEMERSGGDREAFLKFHAAVSLFKMWKMRDLAADANTLGSRVSEAIIEIMSGLLEESSDTVMEQLAK